MEWSPKLEEVRQRNFFEIGGSEAMNEVFWQMTRVHQDSNVLLTGESGTGKTNAARIISQLVHSDHRQKNKFLEVNVAALSPHLLASELFGHEKGAFTGAVEKRIGRFEAANGGSLLIDEVGEISKEIQVEMLSAMDDPRRIERVGSNEPIYPELLVICATTQNLVDMVAKQKFHEALYNRLGQKIIHMPSLKERGPAYTVHAVETLVRRQAERQKKNDTLEIEQSVLQALVDMPHPGNLRGLDFLVKEMCFEAYATNATRITDRELDLALAARGPEQKPLDPSKDPSLTPFDRLEAAKKEIYLATFEELGRSQVLTADALGINRNTLHKQLVEWGVIGRHKRVTSRVAQTPKRSSPAEERFSL